MLRKIKSVGRSTAIALVSMLGLAMFSCTTFLDDEKYEGPPHSLRYMAISDYSIGDDYVSIRPTVMGGENAIFSIANIQGDSPEDVLNTSFSINEKEGNINIKEFNSLLPGTYSLDIRVSNIEGAAVFEDAFSFNAVQVVPTQLRYVPSVYSFYGSETGDVTSPAMVNGGGPYTFSMDDPLNYFDINVDNGEITKDVVVEIGDDEKIIKTIAVTVQNALGEYLQEKALSIELLGANIGRLFFNMEYSTPNNVNLGLINGIVSTYEGVVTEEINEELYTTTLTEATNGPVYKGNRHQNTWHAQATSVLMDVTGSNVKENQLFLSFKTVSSTTECISMVVTEPVDLSQVTSAYTEIVAYKRYIDNDFNQRFVLLACAEEEYVADDMYASNWTVINENIAPGMLKFSNPIKESKLYSDGTQLFDVPDELVGKNVRLALKAVHLNPALGNLGREAFIYKWQVRAK